MGDRQPSPFRVTLTGDFHDARCLLLFRFALALILLTMLVAFRGQISRRIEFWHTGTVTIDGLTYHLNPDDLVITQVILRNSSWEPKEVEFLKSSLQKMT